MSEVTHLNIDEGLKTFSIGQGDKLRYISFNPADYAILSRFDDARKNIEEAENNLQTSIMVDNDGNPVDENGDILDELSEGAEIVRQIDKIICEQIDHIFNAKVSHIVFQGTSPLSSVNGVPFFERFLNAAQEHIAKEMGAEAEASTKRIEKYAGQMPKRKRKQ